MITENVRLYFGTVARPSPVAQIVTIAGTQVPVVFDDEYQEQNEIDGDNPMLQCATVDLPGGVVKGTLVVNGATTYVVNRIEADATRKVTTLQLSRQ